MRWLFVLLLLIGTSAAQTVYDDERGDHQVGRAGYSSGGDPQINWVDAGPLGWYPQADIVSASIQETPSTLRFAVEVNATSGDRNPPEQAQMLPQFDQFSYRFFFKLHDEERAAGFEYWEWADLTFFGLYTKSEWNGETTWSTDYFTAATPRTDVPGWSAVVPKWAIRDSSFVPIRAGDSLQGLTFLASDDATFHFDGVPCPDVDAADPGFAGDCGWRLRDAIPGTLGSFEITQNPPGAGHLFMRMDNPVRYSNGLDTTYLYELEVHNLEAGSDEFLLQVSGTPKGWEVFAPALVEVAGESKKIIAIALKVPFQHVHGQDHFMTLNAVSQRDSSVKMAQSFGVIFPDPPQPGGHHSTVHFHIAEDGYGGWMNTRTSEDEAEAKGTRINPTRTARDLQNSMYNWEIPLNPGLRLGIDMDMSKTGEARFSLDFPAGFEGDIDVEAFIINWKDGSRIPLARGSMPDQTFPANTPTELVIALEPLESGDYVPYTRSTNLHFDINATGSSGPGGLGGVEVGRGGPQAALLTTDNHLNLPLIDFHDIVDPSKLPRSLFTITPVTDLYRAVNPGNTTVFAFNITSAAEKSHTIEWELRTGPLYEDWGQVKPESMTIGAGGEGMVVIRVQPPKNAVDSDVVDYMLIGRSKQDPDQQVFATFVADVDTYRSIPDAAAEADGYEKLAGEINAKTKKSPGPLVLLPLLGAGLLRRKRES